MSRNPEPSPSGSADEAHGTGFSRPPASPRPRNGRDARLWCGTSALLVLGACASIEQIDGTDPAARFATARVRIALGDPATGTDADPAVATDAAASQAFEFAGTYARGDLDVADPTAVRADYEVMEAMFAWSARRSIDSADFGGFVGVQVDHVQLDVATLAGSRTDGNSFIGPVFGAEFGVEPVASLRPYVRGSVALLFPGAAVLQGEIGLDWRVVDPLHLALGYRYWRMDTASLDLFDGETDEAHLTLHGAFVGLTAQF